MNRSIGRRGAIARLRTLRERSFGAVMTDGARTSGLLIAGVANDGVTTDGVTTDGLTTDGLMFGRLMANGRATGGPIVGLAIRDPIASALRVDAQVGRVLLALLPGAWFGGVFCRRARALFDACGVRPCVLGGSVDGASCGLHRLPPRRSELDARSQWSALASHGAWRDRRCGCLTGWRHSNAGRSGEVG